MKNLELRFVDTYQYLINNSIIGIIEMDFFGKENNFLEAYKMILEQTPLLRAQIIIEKNKKFYFNFRKLEEINISFTLIHDKELNFEKILKKISKNNKEEKHKKNLSSLDIYKTEENNYVLLFKISHTICDGASFTIILNNYLNNLFFLIKNTKKALIKNDLIVHNPKYQTILSPRKNLFSYFLFEFLNKIYHLFLKENIINYHNYSFNKNNQNCFFYDYFLFDNKKTEKINIFCKKNQISISHLLNSVYFYCFCNITKKQKNNYISRKFNNNIFKKIQSLIKNNKYFNIKQFFQKKQNYKIFEIIMPFCYRFSPKNDIKDNHFGNYSYGIKIKQKIYYNQSIIEIAKENKKKSENIFKKISVLDFKMKYNSFKFKIINKQISSEKFITPPVISFGYCLTDNLKDNSLLQIRKFYLNAITEKKMICPFRIGLVLFENQLHFSILNQCDDFDKAILKKLFQEMITIFNKIAEENHDN